MLVRLGSRHLNDVVNPSRCFAFVLRAPVPLNPALALGGNIYLKVEHRRRRSRRSLYFQSQIVSFLNVRVRTGIIFATDAPIRSTLDGCPGRLGAQLATWLAESQVCLWRSLKLHCTITFARYIEPPYSGLAKPSYLTLGSRCPHLSQPWLRRPPRAGAGC